MNKKPRLLLADNMESYRRSVRSLLELEGNDVEEASSVEEAMMMLNRQQIDLVLADLRLTDDDDPHDVSGLQLAKAATEIRVPCLIITAFPSVDAVRVALRSAGHEPLAVDFVPKTEDPYALVAAVKSALQRSTDGAKAVSGELVVDLQQRMVWLKGQTLRLSRYQYALLAYLYQNEGVVCSPEELIKAVYDEELTPEQASADKRLERLVVRLRRKIADDPRQPRRLLKEPRRGYRLMLND